MAEIILKIGTVGPDPAYQDGDIVFAPNDRMISHCHLQDICHINKFGFTGDGRRPTGTMAHIFRESTCQFKFERISDRVVRKTNQITLETEELSNVSNAKGEYIHVGEFIARQLSSPGHQIFGTPGNEVWYGGIEDYSAAKLDALWVEAEARLGKRKVDHPFWPFSAHELKNFLALKVDSFDDTTSNLFTAPVFQTVDSREVLVKKRARYVNWTGLALGVSAGVVRNRNVIKDIRAVKSFTSSAIVAVK